MTNPTLGTSSLRPDAARPEFHGEEMSTASIKSGVIGFPQGAHSSDAALESHSSAKQSLGGNQPAGDTSSAYPKQESAYREGIDGPIHDGRGIFSAPQSTRVVDHNSYGATHTPGLDDSKADTGTDRTFPLAGGVTHNRTTNSTTRDREPGTKEKEMGVHNGHGKEALAGAAAAATLSTARPHNQGETDTEKSLQGNQTGHGHHPEALAAATAAAASTHSPQAYDQEQTQGGTRHVAFRGSPEASLSHDRRPMPVTNVSDNPEPRLHVPGEFPSPTPVNQSSAPSYFQSKDTTAASSRDQHGLRHTGNLEHAQTRPSNENERSNKSTEAGEEIFPTEASPYSSTKIDPRVDNRPFPSYDQQKFDPHTSSKHQGRDAVLTGGAPSATTQNLPPSQTKNENSQHQYGRDAALIGAGAGAATTAGMYANQRASEPDSGPAKSTIGPHESNVANILDPRVQPDPTLQKHHHAAPTVDDPAPSTVGPHKSDVANILDPRVLPDPQKQKAPEPKKEHHYGHDAALAGGTGAVGYGAYEATKSHEPQHAAQPAASMNEQPYGSSVPSSYNPSSGTTNSLDDQKHKSEHHYGRDATVAGGVGAIGLGAYGTTRGDDSTQQFDVTPLRYTPQNTQPAAGNQQQYPPNQASQASKTSIATQQPQHHYHGRDAAVVGGLGATGADAYAAGRGNDRMQQSAAPQQQYPIHTNVQAPLASESQQHQRYDSAQDPNVQHQKRDAAILGTTGAVAGAGGAYAYSQHDAEKERKAAEKAQDQQLKNQQKEFERKQKEQERAAHEKQKEIDHQHAKEQKHQNKLVAAANEKRQKEIEKEQREHLKETERMQPEDEGEKKKHHLFGFLHRDKDKSHTGEEINRRQSGDSPRVSKEYAGAGVAAGVGGATAYEGLHDSDSDKKHRNKLHKEPPPGHPAREAMEHQEHQHSPVTGKRQHLGNDGQIGNSHTTIHGDQ
jgi:hypothetical protein